MRECLQPIIVPKNKFMKIANTKYHCPKCGQSNDEIEPYFHALVALNKYATELMTHGFCVDGYTLGIQGCYECDDDEFKITPHVLNHNDWGKWNMQIASLGIGNRQTPAYRIDLWEDHFLKAMPILQYSQEQSTFDEIMMREKPFYIDSHTVNLPALKLLVEATRKYNSALLVLVDSAIASAPVDLTHSLYTHLANVESLVDLFPEDLYE